VRDRRGSVKRVGPFRSRELEGRGARHVAAVTMLADSATELQPVPGQGAVARFDRRIAA
jgi:hypothetical protein